MTAAQRKLLLAALPALLLPALPLHAQLAPAPEERHMLVGAGLGYGTVAKKEGGSRAGPQAHGRFGWRFDEALAVVLEAGFFGLNSEKPQVSDISAGPTGEIVEHRRPRVFRTSTLLLGAQLGRSDNLYIRPAVGVGVHTFAVYGGFPFVNYAETSAETGLAGGVAVGYTVRLGPILHLAIEGVAQTSRGEDSTADRTMFGLQVVPLLQR